MNVLTHSNSCSLLDVIQQIKEEMEAETVRRFLSPLDKLSGQLNLIIIEDNLVIWADCLGAL